MKNFWRENGLALAVGAVVLSLGMLAAAYMDAQKHRHRDTVPIPAEATHAAPLAPTP